MIGPLWLALGFLLGGLAVGLVLGERDASERARKRQGYAITFLTLDEAADAYRGRGTVVRLETFGAYPLDRKEVEHVGARYLAALTRDQRRESWKSPPPRSQTQPLRVVQMLNLTETIQAIKGEDGKSK